MQAQTVLRASSRRAACRQFPAVRSTPRLRALVCRAAQAGVVTEQKRVASVRVDLGSAVEQISLPLTQPNSKLVQARMQFPLGLVLESVDGKVVVTEVTVGSAADAAGCRVGDVVRATSAMTIQMVYPTMNIMFGGVGRPALVKILMPTNAAPFPKVMDAVRSNNESQGGDGTILLVLEREAPEEQQVHAQGLRERVGAAVGAAEAAAFGEEAGGALFDPRIFETLDN
eukprot:GHUV01007505.1.p1 GENE.GHUV01007505.1~~GHUV01007505.1.p1  ORF type:complete len:228 (+),score=53.81 GHUV01007505.1:252-935(+)